MKMSSDRKAVQSAALIAKATTKADLGFWQLLYGDPAVSSQMYSAPASSLTALWRYLRLGQFPYTVWKSQSRVGGFILAPATPHICTFSVAIEKKYRGSGLGVEVMGLLEKQALKKGFMTLRADVYSDNVKSLGLLKEIGFRDFVWLEKNIGD